MKRIRTRWLLMTAYLLALLTFFAVGCGRLIKGWHYEDRGLRLHQELTLEDFEQHSLVPLKTEEAGDWSHWIVSSDTDPKLIRAGELYIESAELRMHREGIGFAPVLYWKEPEQQDYSEARAVYGEEIEPDLFRFQLEGVRVSEIRIDTDSAGGIITRFDGLTLNPPRSLTWAFAPTWKGFFMFLTLPLLGVALVREIEGFFRKES